MITIDQKIAEFFQNNPDLNPNDWPLGNLLLCLIALVLCVVLVGIIGIEIGNINIGMTLALWLQDLDTEVEFVIHQDTAIVDLVLAEIGKIVVAHIGALIVRRHLVGYLIGHLHGLVQDDGIGIGTIVPANIIPFHTRWLAEFLIGQLCVGHGRANEKQGCSEQRFHHIIVHSVEC